MIKTVALTGGVQEVKFAGKHQYFHVHNLGGGEVLVSLAPNIERGKDGVLIVSSGGTGYVQNDIASDTVYLAGAGEVQIAATGNAFSPFNSGSKGGGNGGTTSEGGTVLGTVNYPIIALNLYGESVQDGTPTPENPVDIISVGDDGAVIITVDNDSDITLSAEITSGLPLCSVGSICDELIYNADGTGKIIKRTKLLKLDGSADENWFVSSSETRMQLEVDMSATVNSDEIAECMCNRLPTVTAGQTWSGVQGISLQTYPTSTVLHVCVSSLLDNYDLEVWRNWLADNPITVVYQLATPQEIELSATEMSELMQLQTYNGVTNIFNDEGAEMTVKVATNPLLEYVMPVIDGIAAKFEKRIAALESAITNN